MALRTTQLHVLALVHGGEQSLAALLLFKVHTRAQQVAHAVALDDLPGAAAKASAMPTGDPREGKTPLGAVIDARTVTHVNALIDDADDRDRDP